MKPTMLRAPRVGWVPVRSVVGVAVILAVGVPPVAYAAAGAGDSATTGERPALRNSVTATLKGERVAPGACEYTSRLKLAPGEQAIREEEVASDPANCTMTVRRGTPADAIQSDSAEPRSSRKEGGAAATAGPSGRSPDSAADQTAAAAVRSAGYYKSYFEDPVGIDVNSVRNSVDWYWNGSYVYNGYCRYNYGWYSPSGWGLKENNFFCRYENSQTQVRSSSYVHFKNGVFCFPLDTHTYYERNNAYGKYNGYLVGQVNWRKTGGCTGLLRFRTELRRTLN